MKWIKKCLRGLVYASIFIMIGGFFFGKQQHNLDPDKVIAAIQIPYRQENITHSKKRPGQHRTIKYIVIHNTANSRSTAQNEVDYLSNPKNTSSTSFHIAVDDQEIIEAIPLTEVAYHSGNRQGNQYGIGIEICESGDYAKAEGNAVLLTAYLMQTYDLSIKQVKTHKDFSGKACPRRILEHWETFLDEVEQAYEGLNSKK